MSGGVDAAAEVRDAFIRAACVPMVGGHGEGTLAEADALLSAHPELGTLDLYTAAVVGNAERVREVLANASGVATEPGGPYGWDALTHLCFSRYLRLDPSRTKGLVSAATLLLDAGADPNTGFLSKDHLPTPSFESVLYGAAGVAHSPELTRLLLERGADPNDAETPYHAPEGFDNRAMEILVESRRLTPSSLTTMLHRKLDWADLDAVAWLLERGADPNLLSAWGRRALHQSLTRDNPPEFVRLLLDHGAHPELTDREGATAFQVAARCRRQDALELFGARGFR